MWFLGFFRPNIILNIFKNRIFLNKSTKAFDWCTNYRTWFKKIFYLFSHNGGHLPKKNQKFFFEPGTIIYTPIESPRRVVKKYAVFKNIKNDIRPNKIPKAALIF